MSKLNRELFGLLKTFVQTYADVQDIQFSDELDPPLWFKIRSQIEKEQAARYSLLAASINEIEVSGNARNVRIILDHFHKYFKEDRIDLFDAELSDFEKHLQSCQKYCGIYGDLPKEGCKRIPSILSSATEFIAELPEKSLLKFSQEFYEDGKNLSEMVEILSRKINSMQDHESVIKPWLYLRWVTRHYPDLGIFTFWRTYLKVPLSIPTLRVAKASGNANEGADDALQSRITMKEWWNNDSKAVLATQDNITEIGREIAIDDPAIVDFPFFVLGRWLSGLELNEQNLIKVLRFFQEQRHQIIGKVGIERKPVEYLVMKEKPRDPNDGEEFVIGLLHKNKIHMDYEPLRFNLPIKRRPDREIMGGVEPVRYTPDFIVRSRTKRKKVCLEPHFFWAKQEIDEKDENNFEDDVEKLSAFVSIYEDYCDLIIIIPDRTFDYVRKRLQLEKGENLVKLLQTKSCFEKIIGDGQFS
jgi:hypothetical protein